ncbi:hypothetical protein THAOC_21331 [Thalassiosira oceanica]|uniref:Uncharacterized protein n=1 Tax=Thalassiosira oceanica TaxID=159749 RepID=K0RZN6_THAOC|nr:hypothetical protein THAOC_21331 [Thalassiosira oceanica]|eukprot:EJK58535.1 hypothetical protein THAOC_21331 [Thalassiosira oceanica]
MGLEEATMPPMRQKFEVYQNDTAPAPTAAEQEGGGNQRRRELLVRADDHRIVLAAIDNTITAVKASRRDKYASDADSAKEEFFARCIDQVGESLKQNLADTTTRADSDDEVEGKLDAFQMRVLSINPPSPSSDEGAGDDQSLSSSDDGGEDFEFEFDDRDIIDERAYGQVKELRQRARELSARVISVREEATGRAIEFSRQCLTELLHVHGFDCGDEEACETDEAERDTTDTKGDLTSMNVALKTLASSLQGVDSNLAEKVESIKDTIGTIDDSIVKYQRMSQGDASALSQTEKALIARDEPRSHVRDDGDDDGGAESPMNPDKRLARLLAGVL